MDRGNVIEGIDVITLWRWNGCQELIGDSHMRLSLTAALRRQSKNSCTTNSVLLSLLYFAVSTNKLPQDTAIFSSVTKANGEGRTISSKLILMLHQ